MSAPPVGCMRSSLTLAFLAEVGGGLLNKDFKDIDEELGPTSALAGSIFIVRGEVGCSEPLV